MSNYFLIHVSEDGDITIGKYSKGSLLKAIEEGDHGDLKFREHLLESNPQYWGDKNTLIIKGEIVVPCAKEVITTYDIK